MSDDKDVVISFEGVELRFASSNGVWGIVESAFGLEKKLVIKPYENDQADEKIAERLIVRRGEVLGLLALNGSGKSSLLRLMSGLYVPNSGKVRVFGQDMSSKPIRGRIFKTNPGGALFGDYSAVDNIKKIASLYFFNLEDIDVLARKVLDFLGFPPEDMDKPSDFLSSGNKVKATIATAIVCLIASSNGSDEPKLAIFDEPSATLDPVSISELHETVACLMKAMPNLTIVWATNSVEDLIACSRIVVLNDGHLIDCTEDLPAIKAGIQNYHASAVDIIRFRIKVLNSKREIEVDDFPADFVVRRVRPNVFRMGANPFLWRMLREFRRNKFLLITLVLLTLFPNLQALFSSKPTWLALSKCAIGVFFTMCIRDAFRNFARERQYYRGFEEFLLSPITRAQHIVYAGFAGLLFNLLCSFAVIPILWLICGSELGLPLIASIDRSSLLMVSAIFVLCVLYCFGIGVAHSTLPFIVKDNNHFFYQFIIAWAGVTYSGYYFDEDKLPARLYWMATASPLTYLARALEKIGEAPDLALLYSCAVWTFGWLVVSFVVFRVSFRLALNAKRMREMN